MTKLIPVSTKKGDGGESFLLNGKKISKSNLIFEVLGTLDELNSYLGLVVVKIRKNSSYEVSKNADFLLDIQNTLFYLGAELAGSKKEKLSKSQLNKLERKSDQMQTKMAKNWITKFVLPGGTELGAHIDVARTISRRLERLVVTLSENTQIEKIVLKYVNRLSDYLFILRCFVNDRLSFEEHLFDSKKRPK